MCIKVTSIWRIPTLDKLASDTVLKYIDLDDEVDDDVVRAFTGSANKLAKRK